MYCDECGQKLRNGIDFCDKCIAKNDEVDRNCSICKNPIEEEKRTYLTSNVETAICSTCSMQINIFIDIEEDEQEKIIAYSYLNSFFNEITNEETKFFLKEKFDKYRHEKKTSYKTEENILFCSNCGTKIKNDANFCYKCGVQIDGIIKKDIPQKRHSKLPNNNDYEESKYKVKFHIGVNIWIISCIIYNGFIALWNLFYIMQMSEYDRSYYFKNLLDNTVGSQLFISTVGCAIGCICYISLIVYRIRFPFYVICAISAFAFFYNISILPDNFVWIAILGLINPVITYITMRNKWKSMTLS